MIEVIFKFYMKFTTKLFQKEFLIWHKTEEQEDILWN